MYSTVNYHRTPKEELVKGLPYRKTYAWVLADPKRFLTPVPYEHPAGAVIWVNLDDELFATSYRSPSDTLREKFLTSLANDLVEVGHRARCDRIPDQGVGLRFIETDIPDEQWETVYHQLRDRSLRENEQESAFIRQQEETGILDSFLDGDELEIDKIQPELEIVRSGAAHRRNRELYRYCRLLQAVPTSGGKGRRVTALLFDQGQRRRVLMGALSLSSAGYTQGVRDAYLGWNEIDSRSKEKEIRNLGLQRIMQISVCLAAPPYDHLHAMKLMALLSLSDSVCDTFSNNRRLADRPNQRLLAVVTTSAFGLHAAGFNRIQLKNIEVPNQPKFTRTEMFSRLKWPRATEDGAAVTAARRSSPPLSTMICSPSTIQAARAIAEFIMVTRELARDPMRDELTVQRGIR